MKAQQTQYGNEWDQNTGWWAEKPMREERPSQFSSFSGAASRPVSVWKNAILIVGIVFALLLTVISLMVR